MKYVIPEMMSSCVTYIVNINSKETCSIFEKMKTKKMFIILSICHYLNWDPFIHSTAQNVFFSFFYSAKIYLIFYWKNNNTNNNKNNKAGFIFLFQFRTILCCFLLPYHYVRSIDWECLNVWMYWSGKTIIINILLSTISSFRTHVNTHWFTYILKWNKI